MNNDGENSLNLSVIDQQFLKIIQFLLVHKHKSFGVSCVILSLLVYKIYFECTKIRTYDSTPLDKVFVANSSGLFHGRLPNCKKGIEISVTPLHVPSSALRSCNKRLKI